MSDPFGSMEFAPLASKFGAVFSRFEFALKRGGFCGGKAGDVAEANWDQFAGQLGKRFCRAMSGCPEAEELFTHPPGKHVRQQGDSPAVFVPQPKLKPNSASMLFEAIRRVRNNLLHGEKPHMDHRDIRLIEASLFVLGQAFDRCAGDNDRLKPVREHFHYSPQPVQPLANAATETDARQNERA